jgi:hypothetical protein
VARKIFQTKMSVEPQLKRHDSRRRLDPDEAVEQLP